MPITGTDLHILYMPSDTFLEIPEERKVIFRLFLNGTDELTLSYWFANETEYDTNDPTYTLTVGKLSGVKWNANTHFGDQKIGKNKVERIQGRIQNTTPTPPHVIFIPQYDTTFRNQIVFDVNIGEYKQALDFAALTSMGLTKPSPPRNSKINE